MAVTNWQLMTEHEKQDIRDYALSIGMVEVAEGVFETIS